MMSAVPSFVQKCLRCGHEWVVTRADAEGKPILPKQCPNKKCHSPYWQTSPMSPSERAELVRKRTRAYHRKRRASEASTDGSKA